MKLPPFSYLRPSTLDEALDLLSDDPEGSRLLAGGQTILPQLAARLLRADRLIDIGDLDTLTTVTLSPDAITIGATVTHASLSRATPFFGEVAATIGTIPVRNRGTFGGSIVAGDPAAQWCVVAAALDAHMLVQSKGASRSIPGSIFFSDQGMRRDELLASVELRRPVKAAIAFHRDRISGAATMAVAAMLPGVNEVQLAVGGVAPVPLVFSTVDQVRDSLGRTLARRAFERLA
jgi:carbon-monoxide dehydrogenase medium subunit